MGRRLSEVVLKRLRLGIETCEDKAVKDLDLGQGSEGIIFEMKIRALSFAARHIDEPPVAPILPIVINAAKGFAVAGRVEFDERTTMPTRIIDDVHFAIVAADG